METIITIIKEVIEKAGYTCTVSVVNDRICIDIKQHNKLFEKLSIDFFRFTVESGFIWMLNTMTETNGVFKTSMYYNPVIKRNGKGYNPEFLKEPTPENAGLIMQEIMKRFAA